MVKNPSVRRFMTRLLDFFGEITIDVINERVRKGIDKLYRSIRSRERPAVVLYNFFTENPQFGYSLMLLDEDVLEKIVKLLSDPQFRVWISQNIDEFLDYMVSYIKRILETKRAPPTPSPPPPPQQQQG